MKNLFRGYVKLSPDEFAELWKTAEFSFDANVLLNVYRLPKPASDRFLDVLKRLKSRLWLSHQVAREFFRHYDLEVQAQLSVYDKMREYVMSMAKEFKKEFPRHPYLPVDDFKNRIDELSKSLCDDIDRAKTMHHDPTYDDPVLQLLLGLFDGCVGEKPSSVQVSNWHKDAEARYASAIPPGFEDAKAKKDDGKYGDAIVWFQLMERAKASSKPLVFVTDDSKKDWWQIISGKTIGPHRSLCQEMYEEANVLFHAYPMHRFVESAVEFLNIPADDEVIKEIQEVEQERANASDDQVIDSELRRGFAPPIEEAMRRELLLPRMSAGSGAARAALERAMGSNAISRLQEDWGALQRAMGSDAISRLQGDWGALERAMGSDAISRLQEDKAALERAMGSDAISRLQKDKAALERAMCSGLISPEEDDRGGAAT